MNDIVDSLTRYAIFTGRSTRSQFWNFWALQVLVALIGTFLFGKGSIGNTITTVVLFAMVIPYTAVAIRRMHDINKSGWFFLIPVYNLYLLTKAGDKSSNRFGEPIPTK